MMSPTRNSNHSTLTCLGGKQGGLTLVELMIAMVLGLLLIAGIITILLGTQQTNRTQEALSQVQEAGRFATEALGRDFREGGLGNDALCFANARSLLDAPPLADLPGFGPAFFQMRAPFPMPPATFPADLQNDFETRGAFFWVDRLRGAGTALTLQDPPSQPSAQDPGRRTSLLVDGNASAIPINSVVTVVDARGNCETFRRNNAGASSLARDGASNAPPPVAEILVPGPIDVFFPSRTLYFVGRPSADRPFSLYRQERFGGHPDSGQAPQAIVEGIFDMAVEYGLVDGARQVAEYKPAGDMAAGDWENAAAIRIHILGYSGNENNVVDAPQQNLFFAGAPNGLFNAPDRRLYQAFTTTIAARNRLD